MRRRLQLQRRAGLDPLFALMDCSMSLMFAMALFVRPHAAETIEVPVSRRAESQAPSTSPSETRPVVQVEADGAVKVNGQPASVETVAVAVQAVVATQKDTPSHVRVRLEGHRHVEYGRLSDVREQLQIANFDVNEIVQVQP